MGAKRKRERERNDTRHIENQPESDIKICVSAKTAGQKRYIQEIIRNEIILCQGPAGTGKTVIAIGMALQEMLSGKFERIVLMRPVKEACDEHVGYLPGDLDDKMAPWAAPVIDNLRVFMNDRMIKDLFHSKKIEVIPLAYARGRSLNNAFIILDEAQNCTHKQMLMALTRIGLHSKMVVNGDIQQNDVTGALTGLQDAIERIGSPDIMQCTAIVELSEEDIVRNHLIGEIIKRYR